MTEISTVCQAAPKDDPGGVKRTFLNMNILSYLTVRLQQPDHKKLPDRLTRDVDLEPYHSVPSFEDVHSQNIATRLELSVLGHSSTR